jgi:glycosyltransferase involved in cell wall biosynthesis
MIPVSVVMVTYNEENNVENAMKSVKDFEDVVIVDSFSEDRTVELCRKYTKRIYQHEWRGFAQQKQIAVDYAEKKWILILDADERVTPGLQSEIAEKINSESTSGFYLPRKNYFLGRWIRHSGWWPDYTLRLFKKDRAYVQKRKVHEKVIVDGTTSYLNEPLEHYTYKSISEYIKKMEMYSSLSAEDLDAKRHGLTLLSMLVNPIFVFNKMFFLRQGFRDGVHGFILAVLYSFYTFLKYAKVWEKNSKR